METESSMGPDHQEWEIKRGQIPLTRGGQLPPATDQSVASISSHIRMQFHKVGISDSGGHWRRCVAN
jgi:hypothetical protein